MPRCAPTRATFAGKLYDPRAVERAQRMWLVRMESEHRSTAVFTAMVPQLMEAGAPLDAKAVVLRMAQDELRHTEICARVIEALAGVARLETDLEVVRIAADAG